MPTNALRVRIDRERCQGHARCFALAPELFELDQFGHGREIGEGLCLPSLRLRRGSPKLTAPSLPLSLSTSEGQR
jgi:ferredoxin